MAKITMGDGTVLEVKAYCKDCGELLPDEDVEDAAEPFIRVGVCSCCAGVWYDDGYGDGHSAAIEEMEVCS